MKSRPTLCDRRTRAALNLYKEFDCLRGDRTFEIVREPMAGETFVFDFKYRLERLISAVDEEKMMARVLDGLAAVCEMQRVRVALRKPLELREDGDALTPEQQAARNKVFLAALNTVAKGLTHDGAPERDDPSFSMKHLLGAFPDSRKLTDGRGWLPMHWAVVADEDKESNVTEADVMAVYEADPTALRHHHLAITVTDEKKETTCYTPAHMLCGMEITEKNMSLVRQLSMSDPRAFTTKTVHRSSPRDDYSVPVEHSYTALYTWPASILVARKPCYGCWCSWTRRR